MAEKSARRLTPEGEHWFFGYYDVPSFSTDGEKHLCHRVGFRERMQNREDVAELAVMDIESGGYDIFAHTSAWNFQQGSMLQWHPTKTDTVIYNDWRGGRYVGVERNLKTGSERLYDRPVANVSPTGKHALSINFDRLFDFRPGYGYCQQKDPWADVKAPKDDGVWLTDLGTGRSELIISYETMYELVGSPEDCPEPKLNVNHITFNTDGSRFLFLVRNFPLQGKTRQTALVTADAGGENMFKLSDWGGTSHYHWRDASVVAFYSVGAELGNDGWQLYELTDLTYTGAAIDPAFFLRDGHNSYSPDRTLMLYDSYPDDRELRHLYLYDLLKKHGVQLGSFYSPPVSVNDIRCDLHPRWSPDGRRITFDSTHEGFRGMYVMDI